MGTPLNAPSGTNNLLALALRMATFGREDVGYVSTPEPVVTTVTTASSLQATFPLNGVGNQPPVSCGAVAVLISAVGTQSFVGAITIEAVDTTATTGGDVEVVGSIPALPVGVGGCFVFPFASSLAAGADHTGALTNVVALRAVVASATGTTPTFGLQLVGVGQP